MHENHHLLLSIYPIITTNWCWNIHHNKQHQPSLVLNGWHGFCLKLVFCLYSLFFNWSALLTACVNRRINYMGQKANFNRNGFSQDQLGYFDVAVQARYNCMDFVVIDHEIVITPHFMSIKTTPERAYGYTRTEPAFHYTTCWQRRFVVEVRAAYQIAN